MSNGILVRQMITANNLLGVSAYAGLNAAFPATNLFDRQPKVVCAANDAGAGNPVVMIIGLDLLADQQIDTVAALFTNLSDAGTLTVYASTSAEGYAAAQSGAPIYNLFGTSFAMQPSTTGAARRHLLATGAGRVARFLEIYIVDTAANLERLIRCGVLFVGARLAPGFNFELGSGRKIVDRSTVWELEDGGTETWRKGRTPLARARWSNLSEAELRTVWSMMANLGESEPLLWVEDPDATTGQQERIHYGTWTGLDWSERVQLEKQSIDLTLREWL